MTTNIKEVLQADLNLSDDQIKEVLELIQSDNELQQKSIEKYLIKDIAANNKTKNISFESLKAALTNFKTYFKPNATVVNKWIYADGKEKELKYDTYLYRMTKEEGLQVIKRKDNQPEHTETICHSPVAITKRLQNADDNKVYFEVEFFDRGRIIKHTLSQKDLLSAKGAHDLCTYGLNIPDNRCTHLVNFFSEMLAKNEKNIPLEQVYNTWGWKHNCTAFFIGKTIYSLNGTGSQIHTEEASISNAPEHFINALVPRGTLKNWFKNTAGLLKYPSVRFIVYSSCASPVLEPLNQSSKVINSWGSSTTGKTTKNCVGLSIWGDSSKKDGLTQTLNATSTGVEEVMKVFGNIPVNIDDTQLIDPEMLKQILMMIGNEVGKLRGQKEGGLRDIAFWGNIVLSSGEIPLHNDVSLEGAMVRAFDLNEGIGAIQVVPIIVPSSHTLNRFSKLCRPNQPDIR